jgi:hypothetical protein
MDSHITSSLHGYWSCNGSESTIVAVYHDVWVCLFRSHDWCHRIVAVQVECAWLAGSFSLACLNILTLRTILRWFGTKRKLFLLFDASESVTHFFHSSITNFIHNIATFGWVYFELIALVNLIWIPWMLSASATELLVASTACACGWVPVSLFCYPN